MALLLVASPPSPATAQTVQTAQTAQTARITEEIRTLETYPFSEPNPVPILTRDRRLYPYHSFEGYSTTSEPRQWKVVRLENDYIEVFVLPEVGGKVWGAVVKKTGHEFIYRNEVMKFRNIALRGPWTSGGIEFNFGVIGHSPATATPVDYLTRENPDGSVSCFVGSMDLPSRTHWRVEIRLPADKAYFETNVLWYNPTPLEQPYYNWMTAAAFARDDLEMAMPGNTYLQHSGNALPWPCDEKGRYLPLYRNNAFAGSKSYHVVGELNDFFGGYYQGLDFGFGHWSRHEEMPGQKLWLWALSREGGVWEELLTDTDGQYVEFQAGRLFVQFSPGAAVNPITQAGFDPLSSSRWTETWFPVEGIGGLTEASREGAMYLAADGGRLSIGVNAFADIQDTLKVWSGERLTRSAVVTLTALEPYRTTVEITAGEKFRVQLPVLDLDYSSDPSQRLLGRPFSTDPDALPAIPEPDRMVFQARELLKGRRYREVGELFRAALDVEAWNREALLGLVDLALRRGEYEEGLEHVNRALQLDAYDAEANFLAGNLYRALGRIADARDAFGWAARSTAFRSAAYVQLAELMIGEGAWQEAARYARMAIDFDRYSVPGWRALAVIGRKTENGALANQARQELLGIDPLHHFARAEAYLAAVEGVEGGTGPARADAAETLAAACGGEYPEQTLLELAVGYTRLGLTDDALAILGVGGAVNRAPGTVGQARDAEGGKGVEANPVFRAWHAWLKDDTSLLEGEVDPAFAFPFRPESLPVLAWAADNASDWVWRYLFALNLWALDRDQEAAVQMDALGHSPDFGPALAAQAHLLEETREVDPAADLLRAVTLAPDSRILAIHLIRHFEDTGRWDEALQALAEARRRFPGDFNLDLLQAKALIRVGRAVEATEILAATHVLPSENARESHALYAQAHTLAALDAMDRERYGEAREHLLAGLEWPESLGQGRPYEPEERLGNGAEARAAFQAVVDGGRSLVSAWASTRRINRLDLLTIQALEIVGREGEAREIRGARGTEIDRLRRAMRIDLEGNMILRALSARERSVGRTIADGGF